MLISTFHLVGFQNPESQVTNYELGDGIHYLQYQKRGIRVKSMSYNIKSKSYSIRVTNLQEKTGKQEVGREGGKEGGFRKFNYARMPGTRVSFSLQ